MLRTLRIIAELAAGLIGLLVLLAAILFWRLSASPMSSDLLSPYLVSGIERIFPDAHAVIKQSLLTWDNVDFSLKLHAEQLSLRDKRDRSVADIPQIDLRLNVLGIFLGQFLPKDIVMDRPQFHLEQSDDNILNFGGLYTHPDTGSKKKKENIKLPLEKLSFELTRLHFLNHVDIQNAVFDIHDIKGNILWSVAIPEVTLVRNDGDLNGTAKIDLSTEDKSSFLNMNYNFNPYDQRQKISVHVNNFNPAQMVGGHPDQIGLADLSAVNMPITGDIDMSLNNNAQILTTKVKLQGGKGMLTVPAFWDTPLKVDAVGIEGEYDRGQKKLALTTAYFDFGGAILDAKMNGAPSKKLGRDWDFILDVSFKNWPMDNFRNLWPRPIIPNATEWIEANLSRGNFDHGEAQFKGDLSLSNLDDINIAEGRGTLAASHATVHYMDGMPPVENANATADFDLKSMSLNVISGEAKSLRIVPFTVSFMDLDTDKELISIPLKIIGSIVDILTFIDNPPLRYASKIGLPDDAITGQGDVEVDLRFPLEKSIALKDMEIKASASLRNVASDKLVKGVNISNGALGLKIGVKGFAVDGVADLNTLPFQIGLKESFDANGKDPFRKIIVSGDIKDNQFKEWGIDVLAGTKGISNIVVQVQQTTPLVTEISGTVDMSNAEVQFAQMNWVKPVGAPAKLQFAASIPKKGITTIKSISLMGKQINVAGDAKISKQGDLMELNLDPLTLGRTDASLYFSRADDAESGLRFEAYGKSLDISGLRGGHDPDRSKPRPKEYRLKVGQLFTGATGSISNAEAYAVRDADGWSTINFHGFAEGSAPLTIALNTYDDGQHLTAQCDDFGKMMKGLGFTEAITGGVFSIDGGSAPSAPRVLQGKVKIQHFDVHKLPALFMLLNATSPFGFIGLVTDTTSFDNLRGKFRWDKDVVDLKDVEAAGTSVGINVEGHVDMNTGQAKLNGTLVPFSTFNSLLGSIPLIGDMLTGGNGGGVLAVSYNIDGPLNDPKVSVNPVSLLTPGFLRNLFFGADDDVPEIEPIKAMPETASPDEAH